MRQEKLDNEIKNIFGSMDEHDHTEALARKEEIWKTVHPEENKKSGRNWFLLLFFGSLLFLAGWLLRNTMSSNFGTEKIEQGTKVQSTNLNQLAFEKMKTQLISKEQQLDSLLKANKALSTELSAVDKMHSVATVADTKINTIYVRDTFYIKEVKIEQQIVEKIVKDTVLIEIPFIERMESAMAEVKEEDLKNNNQDEELTEETNAPTSIQFNFTESNLPNK